MASRRVVAERGLRMTPPTDRELQVLVLVAQGLSNAAIGRALFITEDTVKTHVSRILVALGARDRTHASALAVQRELVTIPDPRQES